MEITINEKATAAILNFHGKPPQDSDNPISDAEWVACVINGLIDRSVRQGQKRLGLPVTQEVGTTPDQRRKTATAVEERISLEKQAEAAEAKADEARARANEAAG